MVVNHPTKALRDDCDISAWWSQQNLRREWFTTTVRYLILTYAIYLQGSTEWMCWTYPDLFRPTLRVFRCHHISSLKKSMGPKVLQQTLWGMGSYNACEQWKNLGCCLGKGSHPTQFCGIPIMNSQDFAESRASFFFVAHVKKGCIKDLRPKKRPQKESTISGEKKERPRTHHASCATPKLQAKIQVCRYQAVSRWCLTSSWSVWQWDQWEETRIPLYWCWPVVLADCITRCNSSCWEDWTASRASATVRRSGNCSKNARLRSIPETFMGISTRVGGLPGLAEH